MLFIQIVLAASAVFTLFLALLARRREPGPAPGPPQR
jgi:hypothetical protein